MINFIILGLLLGVTAALAPGPLQVHIITSTLRYGARRALVIPFVPILSDIPLIALTLLILRQIPPDGLRWIGGVGGLLLLYLAWDTWQSAGRFQIEQLTQSDPSAPIPQSTLALLWRSVLINWLSPGAYLVWTTITGPLLISALNQDWSWGVAFLAAFYVTFCGLMALYIPLFGRLRVYGDRPVRVALRLLALILVGLALALLVGALWGAGTAAA